MVVDIFLYILVLFTCHGQKVEEESSHWNYALAPCGCLDEYRTEDCAPPCLKVSSSQSSAETPESHEQLCIHDYLGPKDQSQVVRIGGWHLSPRSSAFSLPVVLEWLTIKTVVPQKPSK